MGLKRCPSCGFRPVSRWYRVAPYEYTSPALDIAAPFFTSGAQYPGVPPRFREKRKVQPNPLPDGFGHFQVALWIHENIVRLNVAVIDI
jgi:hypothetical protein